MNKEWENINATSKPLVAASKQIHAQLVAFNVWLG
jgi:hypothetical protein